MTPQERDLIHDLFDRLATLERNPRDPQANSLINERLRDAPNAIYALVQTVLVQDEALKAANARIQQYEGSGAQPPQEERGFLDSMRDSIFGRDTPRGSVPRVPQTGDRNNDAWGRDRDGHPVQRPPGYSQPFGQSQPQGYTQPQTSSGPSFLGTAAAAAVGVIGGSLLLNGIRSAFGGYQSGPFAGTFGQLGGNSGSPWSGSGGSELSRDAGYGDVGGRSNPQTLAQQDAQQDAEQDAQDDADLAQDLEQDSFDDSDTA